MKVWAETKYDVGSEEIRRRLENHEFDVSKEDPDIVFVLGGDGTYYRNARKYPDSSLLLIRRESFGALAEIDEKDMDYAVDKIKRGEYTIENSMRLEMEYKDQKIWGLNDVIVLRDDESANRFKAYLDDEEIFEGRMVGDGVIASTPLGSTGYNWSAGGPILDRNEKNYLVTPFASLYLDKAMKKNGRNVLKRVEEYELVLDNKKVVIEFERALRNKMTPDGRQGERIFIDIEPGDEVFIRKGKESNKFVRLKS